MFIELVLKYGEKNISQIAKVLAASIGTNRTVEQVRSHAQKYL